MSSTATTTVKTVPQYQKKLEGVEATENLVQLWKEAYTEVQFGKGNHQATTGIASIGQLSRKQAIQVLQDFHHPNQDPQWVPIPVIQAIQALSGDPSKVEQALAHTSLVFTPPPEPVEETKGQRKFRQRMERLRLKHEETKYVKLTNNVQKEEQDDVTAKSMTYAASVGLNMIVAPLSFGCFMYFFAGGMFDYFLGEDFSSRTTGGTDIKRLIVGVVSGVVMLIIEMILFVIRTHEVESYALKKKKKKKAVQPFGVYTSPAFPPTAPSQAKPNLLEKAD